LLGARHALLHGRGQGVAEQGAAVGEGGLLAGGEDLAVGGGSGEVVELADEGDSLLDGQPLGAVPAGNGQGNHVGPSQGRMRLGWGITNSGCQNRQGHPCVATTARGRQPSETVMRRPAPSQPFSRASPRPHFS
jgi:hypothetical protein